MTKWVLEFGANGQQPVQSDGRLDAPAFQRNHEPIWQAFGGRLADKTGSLLEIGSDIGSTW